MSAAKPKRIDWELWAPKVDSKELTNREAARQIGCAESAVRKAVLAWRKRNVSQVSIATKTRAKVDRKLLVDAGTVAEVEDALAQRAADIVTRHRSSIEDAMGIVNALLSDLTTTVVQRTRILKLLEAAGDAETLSQVTAVLSVSEQAKACGTLAASMRTLIGLQRQAYELPARVDADGNGAKGKGKDKATDPYAELEALLRENNGADTGLPATAGGVAG